MKSANQNEMITGQISNQERAMRMLLGLGAIGGVLAGGITDEGHMFTAAVLCMYLGMTSVIGLDPFYVLAEKLMKGYWKTGNSPIASRA